MPNNEFHSHRKVTGLSGNEIFCLNKLGFQPGTLCIGNSVFSMGLVGGITSSLRTLGGGEIPEITMMIQDGRRQSISRMEEEAVENKGFGITGVTTDLVLHANNIEFLTIGSTLHGNGTGEQQAGFNTSGDAQELYCQIDSGFQPHKYVFGNVAYSIGLGGGIGGAFRSLGRGEVPQYTEIFDTTRHLALTRICDEAKALGANSVVGIETTITSILGAQEMVMVGTASTHPSLTNFAANPATSDMTNEEMWNMAHIGFLPVRLVMGVSVYSLGVAGGIKSAFSALARGEITELTSLLYEAREKALDRIQRDAERWGADEVVGVKTHVYELGGGVIEFLALGTAVKRVEGITTKHPDLPPQAIIVDRDTFFESQYGVSELSKGASAPANRVQGGPMKMVAIAIFAFFYIFMKVLVGHR